MSKILEELDKKYNKKLGRYGLTFDLSASGKIFSSNTEKLRYYNKKSHIIKSWEAQEGKQKKAWDLFVGEDFSIIGYGGARGGGKSELAINGNLHWMYTLGAGFNGIYLRNKRSELEDIIQRFLGALRRDNIDYSFNSQKSILSLKNGSILRFYYVDSGGLDGLQGGNINFITLEEPQLMKNLKDILYKVNSLWRSSQVSIKKQFWLFNPLGAGTSFLKKKFVDKGEEKEILVSGNKQIFIRASVYDNPKLLENDPSYLQILKDNPPFVVEAWLKGNFEVKSGLALPDLNKENNSFYDKKFRGWDYPYYISMDWGRVDPTVIGFYSLYTNKYGLKVLIKFKELVYKGKNANEVAWSLKDQLEAMDKGANLKDLVADNQIFSQGIRDGVSISQDFESLGLYFTRSRKSRIAGLNYLWKAIKHKKLLITEDCHNFWKTVPDLVLDDTNNDGDIAPNQDDHSYDETRYMIMHLIHELGLTEAN